MQNFLPELFACTSRMDKSSEEEFAPLFDYTGVYSAGILCLSDDDSDYSPVVSKANRKRKKGERFNCGQEVVNILDDEESERNKKNDEEEDWLPPPPKMTNRGLAVLEDKTLQALRTTKQELESLAASARDLLNSVSDFGNDDVLISEKSSKKENGEKCLEKVERERVLISVQDKDGHKQFRLFADDKFERLFKIYAEKAKLKLESLTFCFDGERISPTATPAGLGLENDDIIEVHFKS